MTRTHARGELLRHSAKGVSGRCESANRTRSLAVLTRYASIDIATGNVEPIREPSAHRIHPRRRAPEGPFARQDRSPRGLRCAGPPSYGAWSATRGSPKSSPTRTRRLTRRERKRAQDCRAALLRDYRILGSTCDRASRRSCSADHHRGGVDVAALDDEIAGRHDVHCTVGVLNEMVGDASK